MDVIVKDTYEEMSREAAQIVAQAIRAKPNLVLGLATGGTPLGLYHELVRMHRKEELDFAKVTTFNLDEYLGLPPTHEQSYAYFMQHNLFRHINVRPDKIYVPSGLATDVQAYCAWYEEEIARAGGIDLQVLGIGRDGHIAFNEPGSSLASRTRVVTLTKETIEDNARFFARPEDVPRFAITMGVGTILEARHCLLLANGPSKAEAVATLAEGPITAQVTASALQMHPQATVILDREAAAKLQRLDYYQWIYESRQRLEQ
jgi:glucosamine-6-phosphate deaminase